MAHPYVELLKDRHVRVLWSGLSLSALGSELYRVGAIWLAAELAGPNASLLVTAQSAAVLAVMSLVVRAAGRRGLAAPAVPGRGRDPLGRGGSAAVVVMAAWPQA